MNEYASVVDAQVQALLQLVQEHREHRCQEILEHARTEAAAVIQQAHRNARARMRRAIEEERTHTKEKVASTRAQLQTQGRQRQQRADATLLEQAWELLRARLRARWQQEEARRAWVRALVQQAHATLPAQGWQVEHPAGWRSEEALTSLREIDGDGTGAAPSFLEAPDIAAGLRIRVNDACLDGTLTGLFASRAEIEALVLAEFRRIKANERTTPRRTWRGVKARS